MQDIALAIDGDLVLLQGGQRFGLALEAFRRAFSRQDAIHEKGLRVGAVGLAQHVLISTLDLVECFIGRRKDRSGAIHIIVPGVGRVDDFHQGRKLRISLQRVVDIACRHCRGKARGKSHNGKCDRE